jgi:hypothetical protein
MSLITPAPPSECEVEQRWSKVAHRLQSAPLLHLLHHPIGVAGGGGATRQVDGTKIMQVGQDGGVERSRSAGPIRGCRPRPSGNCLARCERRPVVRAIGPGRVPPLRWPNRLTSGPPWRARSGPSIPTTCSPHCWSGDGQRSNTSAIFARTGLLLAAGKAMGRRARRSWPARRPRLALRSMAPRPSWQPTARGRPRGENSRPRPSAGNPHAQLTSKIAGPWIFWTATNSPRYRGVLAERGVVVIRLVCWGNGRLQVGRPGLSPIGVLGPPRDVAQDSFLGHGLPPAPAD